MDIIRHILKKISEGKTTFKSASNSQSDMEDFQSVAKVFVHMNKQGWLDSFKEHRESRTANNWYDLIFVTGLSSEGAQYLQNIPSEDNNATNSINQEDIIDLKPNFMGLGLNINALLRWWKKKKDS